MSIICNNMNQEPNEQYKKQIFDVIVQPRVLYGEKM